MVWFECLKCLVVVKELLMLLSFYITQLDKPAYYIYIYSGQTEQTMHTVNIDDAIQNSL